MLVENTAGWTGGCICADTSSNITVSYSIFRNNTANGFGGAIYAHTIGVMFSLMIVYTFSKNKAQWLDGGIIYAYLNNNIAIGGSTFRENTAEWYRSGAHISDMQKQFVNR